MSLLPRVTQAQIGPNAVVDLYIWLAFQFVADQFLLPILFLTFAFSKSITRHFTLVNFVFTWIIAGVVSSLLFYAQKQIGPEPSLTLCIFQGATLEAVPPMTSVAVFLVIFSVWRGIVSRSDEVHHRSTALYYISLILPYIAFVAFSVAGILIGANDPTRVSRDRRFFYCSIDFSVYSTTQSLFTATTVIICLVMELHITYVLTRNWRALRKVGNVAGMSISTVIRVLLFGIYLLFSLISSIASAFNDQSAVPDMFSATIGMAVFIIFGLQRDVMRAWCFWLPPKPASMTHSDITFNTDVSPTTTFKGSVGSLDEESYPTYGGTAKAYYGSPSSDELEPFPYNTSFKKGGGEGKVGIFEPVTFQSSPVKSPIGANRAGVDPFPYGSQPSYDRPPQPQDPEKASLAPSESDASSSNMTVRPLAPSQVYAQAIATGTPTALPKLRIEPQRRGQQGQSMLPSPYSPPRGTFFNPNSASGVPQAPTAPPVAYTTMNQPAYVGVTGGGNFNSGQPTRQTSVDSQNSQTASSVYSQRTTMTGAPAPRRPSRPNDLDIQAAISDNRQQQPRR